MTVRGNQNLSTTTMSAAQKRAALKRAVTNSSTKRTSSPAPRPTPKPSYRRQGLTLGQGLGLAQAAEEWGGPLPELTAEKLAEDLVRAILCTSDQWNLSAERQMASRPSAGLVPNFWIQRDTIRDGQCLALRLSDLETLEHSLIELTTKYGGTAGTDSVGATATSGSPVYVRGGDPPDPATDLWSSFRFIPSRFGEGAAGLVNVPTPTMVAEPGDAGFAKTGEAFTAAVDFSPHSCVLSLRVSRIAELSQRELIVGLIVVGLQKLREKAVQQILAGSGAGEEVTGIFADSAIGKTDVTSLSDLTPAALRSAMSGPMLGREPRLLLSREAQISLRAVSSGVTGVTEAVLSGGGLADSFRLDGTPSVRTSLFAGATGTDTAAGLAVAVGEILVKIWGNAVFASAIAIDGVFHISLELYLDSKLPVPSYGHRFVQS